MALASAAFLAVAAALAIAFLPARTLAAAALAAASAAFLAALAAFLAALVLS